jgi:hypothetical protein
MAYLKTTWATGDIITATKLNNAETQYDEAKLDVDAHAGRTDNPHGVTAAQAGALPATGKAVDSSKLNNKTNATTSAVSSIAERDTAGDLHARLFRSEYDTTNATVNYIMTQIDTATNNYIRPSTPAQVKAVLDVPNTTKVYGNATYTDAMNAGVNLTKSIPLGSTTYKHGRLTIGKSASHPSILVHFGTDNLKTLVAGFIIGAQNSIYSGAWSRRYIGKVTRMLYDVNPRVGMQASGDLYIEISDIYISGSNLNIVFSTVASNTSGTLDCVLDWEVW